MALGAPASGADRAVLGWTALIAILLLAPADLIGVSDLGERAVRGLDKPVHFVLFFVLAALAARAARHRTRRPLVVAAVLSLLYGALLEGLQALSGVRAAEVADLVADGLGSLVGVLVSARWWRP